MSGLRQRIEAHDIRDFEERMAPPSTRSRQLRIELDQAREELEAERLRRLEIERRLQRVTDELEALRGESEFVEAELDDDELVSDAIPSPAGPTSQTAAPPMAGMAFSAVAEAVPHEEPSISDMRLDAAGDLDQGVVDVPDYGDSPTFRQVTVTSIPPPASVENANDERREEERRPCEFVVEFVHETQFFTGLSMDVSSGGVFIATYNALPVGTLLKLSFDLPDGAHIDAVGEVRWIRERFGGDGHPGIGVAFTELSAPALAHVRAFCRSRPPLYFEF